MSGTFNINQINVNVTDVIPPENFATIDSGTIIGTVHTKAQDNEWRSEVEAIVATGIKGVLKPNTPYDAVTNPYPKPWVAGDAPLFEMYVVNESGTFPNTKDINDENITVTPLDLELNEIQIWVKNGVSELHKKAMPQASVNVRKWEDLQMNDFPLNQGSQVIYQNSHYIVKDGEQALQTDIPNTDSDIWSVIGFSKELIALSTLYPLKQNPQNYDLEKANGRPQTYKPANEYGFGYISTTQTTEEKLINCISYFVASEIPNNSVTVKLYSYNSSMGFSPTSPDANLLVEETFDNFNQNLYGRFYWFFDPILFPKGKNIVLSFETDTANSLTMFINNISGTVQQRIIHHPPINEFLDPDGNLTDEPVITFYSNQEIAEIKRNIIFDRIIIAEEFPTVVGVEFNAYLDNILNVPNKSNFATRFRDVSYDWASSSPNLAVIPLRPHGLQFTPTEGNKTYKFVVEVLNNSNFQVVAQKKFNIKTYINSPLTEEFIIETAGDSTWEYDPTTAQNGRSVKTLNSLFLAAGGIAPKFIGTKTASSSPLVKHNGFAGQTWGFFLSNSSPYFVGGEINFKNYATSQGVTKIDFLTMQLGINDVGSGLVDNNQTIAAIEAISNQALTFVNIALSSAKGFPNMKILISLEPFGGSEPADKSFKDIDELKRKMFILYGFLIDKLKGTSNVHFIWTFNQIDRKFGYPFTMSPPNSYDTSGLITVPKWSDPVHPNLTGYDQIAAAYYSKIRQLLS